MTVRGLEGRVAVVTGAARGIGLATARVLSERGARVIAVDIDEAALHGECARTSELRIVHDMAADPAPLLDALTAFGDTVCILVNNVGISANRSFLELDDGAIDLSFRTNVLGPLSLTRHVARTMIDTDTSGSIVFVSSLHSSSVRRSLDYSTSKAAIAMAVRELAEELGRHRIRVNAVSPGDIHSDPTRHQIPPDTRRIREQVIPLDRLGSSDDIAKAIAFLVDDAVSSYITGTDLVIDGGLSTTNWVTTRPFRSTST